MSGEVCPWNLSFNTALDAAAFAGSREGTRALAREILRMEPADYAAAFKGSAIKRAKLWMPAKRVCGAGERRYRGGSRSARGVCLPKSWTKRRCQNAANLVFTPHAP